MDPFVHLHVASGYSLKYGASHPHQLVARAAEVEMDTLALTDRDGVYGAVRFAKACMAAGIRPVLGVDLAVEPSGIAGARAPVLERTHRPLRSMTLPARASRAGGVDAACAGSSRLTPARGGSFRERVGQRLPRVTLLAGSKAGWAALCRLVSATHLRGERGVPVATRALIGEHLCGLRSGQDLLVLLGPASELGWAATLRRDDLAGAVLRSWHDVVDPDALLVEVVSHRAAGHGPGSSTHAARMLAQARRGPGRRLGAVISNAVRYANRIDATTIDVLDAVRRLVPLDPRHLDRSNAEGYLKSGKEMAEVADEVCRLAGLRQHDADRLLAYTRAVADRCAVDPRRDLGLGEVHLPELHGQGSAGDAVLRARCEAAIPVRYAAADRRRVRGRLDDELAVVAALGYAPYFLTVADVVDLIRDLSVRVAARGSGAGSLVNYLLGISGVDPLRYGLLMERFLSPLRQALPDIDLDVESARRTEVYERILDRYSGERCACVSMMDSYRVRHAIRDVGAALGMPKGEVDSIAKAFPHIRAQDARAALRELPELRSSGLGEERLGVMFRLVERLDGLPRHIAVHPCGVLLSDATLLDRTPVEASYLGFPMSQFDKEDVEDLGLLKLDVLGIRMQSAMAYAAAEIERVDGLVVDVDDESQVPRDDPATFALIQSARTLGCFQIESPGQRELVGKFAPETFEDIVIDISLFRPGPVKSDMVHPFLRARQGWSEVEYPHPSLEPVLRQTWGVVVFHEQVIEMIATLTGCSLAEADEARRALGDRQGKQEIKLWYFPRVLARGYTVAVARHCWDVLEAFASFGFCKAHAAAFALPTYQSAWLKTHHPAAFLAGVLTHDPGMYPKRLILDDARQFGITVLPLDVNVSDDVYRVERVDPSHRRPDARRSPIAPIAGVPDAGGYGIRLALTDVKGISDAEVARIVAARPYHSLTDLWQRARPSRPVAERLVLAGALDAVYGIGSPVPVRRRGVVTRRDLLLQISELDRWSRATERAVRSGSPRPRRNLTALPPPTGADPWHLASAQSQAAAPVEVEAVQLTFDLGDRPALTESSGLPEMTGAERVRAELEILGLDVSHHVVDFYAEMLEQLGVTWSRDLLRRRSRSELLVAGVKVATQTPPIRSGRRVVFLTVDDGTGPVDAAFFEDAQGPYAATLFHSWLLVVRGVLRRTGPRGVSLRATGCWELSELHGIWQRSGVEAVFEAMQALPPGFGPEAGEHALTGAAESMSTRPVMARPPRFGADESDGPTAGGMGRRRVLVHPSGFKQSPYADVKPAGDTTRSVPRHLWHRSPGSPG